MLCRKIAHVANVICFTEPTENKNPLYLTYRPNGCVVPFAQRQMGIYLKRYKEK